MWEILSRPAFVAPATLVVGCLTYMIWQLIWPWNLPKLPVAGSRSSDWLPLVQARWRNSTNYRTVSDELDTLYKHKPCLVPIGGSETICLLPASEAQHVADQPDSVLNMPQPMIQGLQFKYTVVDDIIMDEPIHQKLVTGNLTHAIGAMVGDVLDETRFGFEKHWGMDTTEFRDVQVFDTLRRIISGATNRAFVGLPSCRDPALIEAGMNYARALPAEAGKLRMYPNLVKPLIAPFYTKGTHLHTHEFYDILRPEIQRRLDDFDAGREPKHDDFLQWSITQARSHPDPRMAQPSTLAGRVLMLNFGAIHTTSFTMTHALFDLLSSHPSTLAELRAEIKSVLVVDGVQSWSKKALAQMEKLDSLVRETLRLNMASTFGIPRLVIAREGFTTRSGVHIPRGNIIAVPGKNIGRDEAFYGEDAGQFKPFRFADKRREYVNDDDFIKRARQAAPTTTAEYLPFGHGKHACPGRFFATNEMKLILAYMILHYELEPLDKRPDDIYIGAAKLPPLASSIRIRRRREDEV